MPKPPLNDSTTAASKRKWYASNKDNVQIARIVAGLNRVASGDHTGRKASIATLTRYKLYNPATKTITIPEKFKTPQVVYDKAPLPTPTTQVINVNIVRSQVNNPVSTYDPANDKATGSELKNWVYTVLVAQAKNYDGEVRGKTTIEGNANVAKDLFQIRGLKYDENVDFLPYLMDAPTTLEKMAVYPTWKRSSTISKHLSYLLLIAQQFPPCKKAVPQSILTMYDNKYKYYCGLADTEQESDKEPVFEWRILRNQVFQFYGRESYEALYMLLLNEVIARDNLGCTMRDFNDKTPLAQKVNYCIIDRVEQKATLLLQSYKTKSSHGDQAIKLENPMTVKLILKLHPIGSTQNTLFPASYNKKSKLGAWIISRLKNIPLLKDEKLSLNYLRHSIVSSAIARIGKKDPQRPVKLQLLAEKAMHTTKSQKKYVNDLKDESGKLIVIDPATAKEYDRITTVIEGNDGTVEKGEEVGSGSKKAAKAAPKKSITPTKKPVARKAPAVKKKLLNISEDIESDGESDPLPPPRAPPAAKIHAPPPKLSRRAAIIEEVVAPTRRSSRVRVPTKR